MNSIAPRSRSTAFVLAGGGARGAYEVGVLQYLEHELGPKLGRRLRPGILAGTSIGALHACQLAAAADEDDAVTPLMDRWRSLRMQDVVSFGWWDVVRLVREAFGRPRPLYSAQPREGGLVDPRQLADHIFHWAHWRRIGWNVRKGVIDALALTATHVASGKPTVFLQTRERDLPAFDATYRCFRARIGPRHALASAAVPILFPPVAVDGAMYVDGSLRMNVPLSPALKLGAQRILVVSLRSPRPTDPIAARALEPPEPTTVPNALFLLGKAMNALLLDNTDEDLDRLARINQILEAGVRAFGPGFVDGMNAQLHPAPPAPLRYVHALHVRPSRDLAELATDYLLSSEFDVDGAGRVGKTLKEQAEKDPRGIADTASHLLFDGGFADRLIALGRSDARALEERWLRFWSDEPISEAEHPPAGRNAA